MGEVFDDDSILDIALEGLTDEYLQLKYTSPKQMMTLHSTELG